MVILKFCGTEIFQKNLLQKILFLVVILCVDQESKLGFPKFPRSKGLGIGFVFENFQDLEGYASNLFFKISKVYGIRHLIFENFQTNFFLK